MAVLSLTRRHHQQAARVAAWLVFAGVALLPLLHNVTHRADHSHGPRVAGVLLGMEDLLPHSHDDGVAHTHAAAPTTPGNPLPVPDDGHHGEGSAAHLDLAVLAAVVALLFSVHALRCPEPAMRDAQRVVSALALLTPLMPQGPPGT